jgi:hypothetical protein
MSNQMSNQMSHQINNDNVYVDPQVQKILNLYADIFAGDFYSLPIRRQLELQADRLTEAHHNRDDSVCFQIESWHPELVGEQDEHILVACILDFASGIYYYEACPIN